ncbi:MAG: lipopolysaccharide heptosyltransferase II, partial [Nitrospirales bacterium]
MSLSCPSSILIRVPNWIGDAVLCEPALRDLRDRFPSAKLAILARPGIGELFRAHPAVDQVLNYHWRSEHHGMIGLWKLTFFVKSLKFDMAVLFQNAFEAACIAWGAGIPRRVGYATDGRRYLLTQPIAVPGPGSFHHMQYYRKIVAQAFACESVDRTPSLAIRFEEEAHAAIKFPKVFDTPEEMLVGINPGSIYGSAKRWLPERFAEVANSLLGDLRKGARKGQQPRCVIVGGSGEEDLGRVIGRSLGGHSIVLSGQTSIRELMAVVKRCAIFLTNDTGPMHLAQALGVPVVAIFGSTDPEATGPVGQAHAVVRSPVRCAPCFIRSCPIDHRCMTSVSAKQVL